MNSLREDESSPMEWLDGEQLEEFKDNLKVVMSKSAFEVDIRQDGFVGAIKNRWPRMTANEVLVAIHMGVTGQLIPIYGGVIRQDVILSNAGFMNAFQEIRTDKMPWI